MLYSISKETVKSNLEELKEHIGTIIKDNPDSTCSDIRFCLGKLSNQLDRLFDERRQLRGAIEEKGESISKLNQRIKRLNQDNLIKTKRKEEACSKLYEVEEQMSGAIAELRREVEIRELADIFNVSIAHIWKCQKKKKK